MTEYLPARLGEKLRQVIADAIASLAPDDLAKRVAEARRSGQIGSTVFIEGDLVRVVYGGRDLVLVERDLLIDDLADLPPAEWIDAPPDTIPSDWGSGDVP